MKYIKFTAFVGLLMISLNSIAQSVQNEEVVVPLSKPAEPGKLNVWVLYGSIKITVHNGKDVIINSSKKKEIEKEEYKNGLRKISSGSAQFSVEEYDNKVDVRSGNGNKSIDFDIKIPRNFDLELKTTNDGDIYVEGVHGEMEISNINGAITLKNIAGSVIADALNKDIVVNFTEVSNNSAMAFTSLNGDLHVSFPTGMKADIKAKTEWGEIFTDFEIVQNKEPETTNQRNSSGVYKVTVDKWVKGTINGGGAEILFKTLNGDILIREE